MVHEKKKKKHLTSF